MSHAAGQAAHGLHFLALPQGVTSGFQLCFLRLGIAEVTADGHEATFAVVEEVCAIADDLSAEKPDIAPVVRLLGHLRADLLPHERDDEELLVPLVARALGPGATAALSRTHAEIEHQVARLQRLLEELQSEDVQPDDIVELRRLLYGLYGVLRLHNAQEDETAFSLLPAAARPMPAPAR